MGESVHVLGKGIVGGPVYRVTPFNGAAKFEIKIYYANSYWGTAAKSAKNDAYGLKILERIVNRDRGRESPFESIRLLKMLGHNSLMLENAEGLDLDAVAKQFWISEGKNPIRLFLRKIREMKRWVAQEDIIEIPAGDGLQGGTFKLDPATLRIHDPASLRSLPGAKELSFAFRNVDPTGDPKYVSILIKMDNVLLTPQGQLKIIDSF